MQHDRELLRIKDQADKRTAYNESSPI